MDGAALQQLLFFALLVFGLYALVIRPQRVRAKAVELATLSSPRSVRIIKAQLMRGRDESLGDATRFADEQAALCRGSEDFKEGGKNAKERTFPVMFLATNEL